MKIYFGEVEWVGENFWLKLFVSDTQNCLRCIQIYLQAGISAFLLTLKICINQNFINLLPKDSLNLVSTFCATRGTSQLQVVMTAGIVPVQCSF